MSGDAGVAPAPYSTHVGDVERDREIVLGIWRGNLGQPGQLAAKYDWFYRQCPWGVPLLVLLRHDPSGEWVGVAAAGPRRLHWQGHELRAGLLVDLAVVPGHRTLGPALALQRALFARATEAFDVVYGFPNAKAVVAVRRIGYEHFADIVRLSRVLRHAPYLERYLPRPLARVAGYGLDMWDRLCRWSGRPAVNAEWLDAADRRLVATPAGGFDAPDLVSPRDPAALQWRFDRAPCARVRYLRIADSADGTRAWFACQVEGDIVRVQDMGGAMDASAVAALIRSARALGARSVSIELTRVDAVWSRAGFVERSRRPIYGHWRCASGNKPSPERIRFTPADEDE